MIIIINTLITLIITIITTIITIIIIMTIIIRNWVFCWCWWQLPFSPTPPSFILLRGNCRLVVKMMMVMVLLLLMMMTIMMMMRLVMMTMIYLSQEQVGVNCTGWVGDYSSGRYFTPHTSLQLWSNADETGGRCQASFLAALAALYLTLVSGWVPL